MILSEKRASAALKPWWDIIYGHGLLALLGLGKKQKNVKRVPYESEWYLAGEAAQQRIDELEPFYKVKKEEDINIYKQYIGIAD